MKKIVISALMLSTVVALSQTVPSGAGGTNSGSGWWRGGNTQGNGANIMATTWNSPIYWYTDGYAGGTAYQANRARMKLNGTFDNFSQYPINGFSTPQGVNTSGYLLIGNNNNSITDNAMLFNQKGAFSLLHLNGVTASNSYQEFGYRPWMKTGITLTGNRDLSYFGLRQLGEDEDITETAIVWSDNAGNEFPGPDDMVFRFTSGGGSNYSTNFSLSNDMDGLHISRFTSTGLMGLGNTFGVNVGSSVNYNTPRSLLPSKLSVSCGSSISTLRLYANQLSPSSCCNH